MVCLLYADGTTLLPTTAADLQYNLNMLYKYCNKWKLKINASNTKILILTVTLEIISIIVKLNKIH